jgi:hypothetical protein
VLFTRGGDRAVPLWGHPEEDHASETTLNTTLQAEDAHLLAQHGVPAGASIAMADAAVVIEDDLAARGATFSASRLPATYNECGRVIAEAGAQENWDEVGVLAHTKPPGTAQAPPTTWLSVPSCSPGRFTLRRLCRPVARGSAGSSALSGRCRRRMRRCETRSR